MQLRRLVRLVSVVVFVDTLFYAVVVPLLPHYADDLHLSKAGAGVLTAAYPAGTLLGSLPAGLLSARIGARRTLLVGLASLAGSSLAFGFAHHIVLLDAARFVQGFGSASTWAGGLAWLIADAPAERRGALIGTAMGAAIGGALFGPVVGALAVATSPELVFGSVVLLAAVLAAMALRTDVLHVPAAQGLSELRVALTTPRLRRGMWLVALPSVSFGVLDVLGPLDLDRLGAGTAAVAGVFLVAAAGEAAISPVVGRVSDRRGRMAPIRIGLGAATAMLVIVTLPGAAWLLAAVLIVTAASLGVFWAPAMALLSDAAEQEGISQGFAFALVNLAWAGGQVTGAGAGGVLAKATADAVPYLIAAALCAGTWAVVGSRRSGRDGRAAADLAAV